MIHSIMAEINVIALGLVKFDRVEISGQLSLGQLPIITRDRGPDRERFVSIFRAGISYFSSFLFLLCCRQSATKSFSPHQTVLFNVRDHHRRNLTEGAVFEGVQSTCISTSRSITREDTEIWQLDSAKRIGGGGLAHVGRV